MFMQRQNIIIKTAQLSVFLSQFSHITLDEIACVAIECSFIKNAYSSVMMSFSSSFPVSSILFQTFELNQRQLT
jgi:hypothetical protein